MADEVERLAVAPFREIVEKGSVAIDNAPSADEETSPLMLKAAQSLVREGERALKRIEPLCAKNFDEYGVNFVDAIKENDEIAQYRSELEDLLWDFDEYVEVTEFDPEKFEELQKASRKAAPKIVDILKRMKLVAPAPTSASLSSRSVMPDHLKRHSHDSQVSTKLQLSSMMGTMAGPDEGLDANLPRRSLTDSDRNHWRRSEAEISDETSDPPPRPPSADPWQVGIAPPVSPIERNGEGDRWERDRRPPAPSDSPTIPPAQPASPRSYVTVPLRTRNRMDEPSDPAQRNDDDDLRMRAASRSFGTASDGSRSPGKSNRWTISTQGSMPRSHSGFMSARSPGTEGSGSPGPPPDSAANRSPSDASSTMGHTPSIPENVAVHSQAPKTSLPPIPTFPPRQTSLAKQSSLRRTSRGPSTESINSSVFDIIECMSAPSPSANTTHRNSVMSVEATSPRGQPPEYMASPPLYQQVSGGMSSAGGSLANNSSSTLTVQPGMVSSPRYGGMDEGLIPVDMENPSPEGQLTPLREPDCTIGPFSSFYKMKGFCKGAEEVMAGRLGFKKIKRPVGGFSMAIVAKCNHCLFEIDFKSVEQDLNNDSSGSFTSNSIGFRLRILQKSHLQIRHIEEHLYGCLFCIQQGKTVEESDATVFFNQSQLFAHMARHPRPLPAVPGVTVFEGPDLPLEFRDNFDLHFPHAPMPSVMMGLSRELSRLPSATATETRKIQNGVMRSPPGRDKVLHYAVGARIIGIEFPIQYEGKWGIGWHDGVRAAFETDSIQIDAPPKNEIKMQGTSNIQAVARWKWNHKGDDRWLRFDKGDVIKNIGWAYTDHWCWSGTTSKGWGIFPQSHLDHSSKKTVQPGDNASVSSWEKKGPLRFQLSLRKNSDRKVGAFDLGEAPILPSSRMAENDERPTPRPNTRNSFYQNLQLPVDVFPFFLNS